jgi:hypothetical protein
MRPFLCAFAVEPLPANTVRLRYDASVRRNVIVAGGPARDGTLITKSREASDQCEVGALLARDGTRVTATREGRDAVEGAVESFAMVRHVDGTLLTDSREARDQSEHVANLLSNATPALRPLGPPWPITRLRP